MVLNGEGVIPRPNRGVNFLVVTIPGAASGILRIGLVDIKDLRMLTVGGHDKELFCSSTNSLRIERH